MKWQWLVILVVGVLGAAGGAYFGDRVAPDAIGVPVSLGVAGFGVGALVGVIVSGWWKPPPKPQAPPEAATTTTEFTARAPVEREEPSATSEPGPEHEAAMVDHPPPPPPPEGGEPGWYNDQTGVRRYWDGERWTEIVWRERRSRAKGR